MTPQPLLLAVRSGAPVSMPGMLLTLLHCGLTWDLAQTLNDAAAWHAYAGLIRELARAQGADLPPANDEDDGPDGSDGRELVRDCCRSMTLRLRRPFPQEPGELLRTCVAAVFDSWWTPRAMAYRRLHQIDDSLATAVTVQAMIATEVAGVLFSRDPQQRRLGCVPRRGRAWHGGPTGGWTRRAGTVCRRAWPCGGWPQGSWNETPLRLSRRSTRFPGA